MRGPALIAVVVAVVLAGLVAVPGSRAEPSGLPAEWTTVSAGPAGGAVWSGPIPNTFASWDHRASAVYLPPGYDPARRYPVIYLLHGMRGSPSEYYDSLHLATVADGLIASGRTQPFIAVMPVAGPLVKPDDGEWAGIWEDYVVADVVPWVDAHLATIPSPQGRALEGLCAGGFGAVDIGLRHRRLFGTLGSWEGYFSPVFRDGPFARASAADLAAHDPTLLLRREASELRRDGVRFYISVGGNHGAVLREWSLAFAAELRTLHLPYELWLLPASERGHLWRATFPSALRYAAASFQAA
jgi:enterochelin esterase-like enzyme